MGESFHHRRSAPLHALGAALLLAGCGSGGAPGKPSPSDPPAASPSAGSPSAGPSHRVTVPSAPSLIHPCRVQDGRELDLAAVQALGTEPFWSAAVDGRCITWSTPEVPGGTRLWTRHARVDGADRWVGALQGLSFELSIRKGASCSDGMSDTVYPLVAQVRLGQDVLQGCARPAAIKAGAEPVAGNPARR